MKIDSVRREGVSRKLPLRTRVLLATLASTFLVVAASEAYRLWSVRYEGMARLEDKVGQTAGVLATGLGRAMFDYNEEVVTSIINAVQGDPEIAGAVVADDSGKIVARFGQAAEGEHRIVVRRPVVYDNGGRQFNVGRLLLAASTEPLDRAQRQQVSQALGGLLAISAALWLAIVASFRRITAPLGEITAVMLRLVGGEKEIAVPGQGRSDEIGDMARAVEVFRRHAVDIERLEAEKATEAAVRESEERLRLIVDAMPLPLMMQDTADGRVLFANRRMREEFLGDAEGAEGLFAEPADRDCFRQGCADSGEVSQFELPLFRRDGSRAWGLVAATPTRYRGRAVVLAGINDISARREAEEQMAQARDLADRANQLKSEFLANVSHEIRTPMNAVLGMTELCLKTDLTAKQRNYVQKAHNSARALLRIISDILDFSKMEAGRLSVETIEFVLDDVLTHVSDVTTVKAQEKGLELVFTVAPAVSRTLVGDPLRFGQILINLIGNAVKFTERGEIVVSVDSLGEDDSGMTLQVKVRDTGIGMTAEQVGRLFNAFTQADASTTRRFGGTGLGLAISKRIANLMGGDIVVESEPGIGSTFVVDLHFGRPSLATRYGDEAAALRGTRIMVVDDNQASRELLGAMLDSFGCSVAAAASGMEAIAELQRGALAGEPPFDVVLLDYMMPGLDGVETAQRILADDVLAKPPVLAMVTAYGREEVMQKASQAGLSGFLVKPVSPSTMVDTILGILGREPLARHGDTAAAGSARAADSLRGARVLLVEDNEINQELALEILAEAGISADVAGNGAEALERLRDNAYDGVLMDCQMPVMDGYEASRAIRGDPAMAALPIIAMTANAMQGDRERCLAAGMNDHVTKPIDFAHLLATLARWIKPRQPAKAETPVVVAAVSPVDTSAFAGLERFDVAAGLRRTQGNAGLYRRLLQKFLEGNRDFAERYRAALDDADTVAPERTAHTLKGLAATLGAMGVAAAAGALEQASHRGDGRDSLLARLETVTAELQPALVQLEALLGDEDRADVPAAVPADGPPPAVPAEQLSRLAALLEEGEADAVDLLDDILAGAPQLKESMAVLRQRVSNYDFFAAHEELSTLAERWGLTL